MIFMEGQEMRITYKLTKEESKRRIENYIRSISDLGVDWKLTESYFALGEYTFEKEEEKEEAKDD